MLFRSQEVLTHAGVLERFLLDPRQEPRFTQQDVNLVRDSWMEMWSLDSSGGTDKARAEAQDLVLKPQREGGGNNVYKDSISPFLDTLPDSEREAWIAMRLIHPPPALGNYLVRSGSGEEGAGRRDVISELGIFGWALWSVDGAGTGAQVKEEREVGWLVRTKGKESNEGGVAAGFSVLDSVMLV